MSLTKYVNIEGEYVSYDTKEDEDRLMEINDGDSIGDSIFCSLDTARAIHAELTELFKLLDEK